MSTAGLRVVTREQWPFVPGGELHRRLRGLQVNLDCDVVVVGSGAGGAVVAAELAEGGLDVIVLEEGGHHPTETLSGEATAMARMLYRDGGVSVALGRPPVLFAEGMAVGGSTLVNGGMTFRPAERVLELWQREHGLDRLLSPTTEYYFERVEKMISAATQDPETRSPDNELLREGAERLGWEVLENVRNQLHCAGSNNCAFGCPTGAKRSTLVSYLPRAQAFGARIFADCRVERVTRAGDRVVGVEGSALDESGAPIYGFTVRAKLVVLAAGAINTPRLLLRSRIDNRSGAVGANLTLHPNVKVVALFDDDVYGWQGVHQQYQVRQFHDEGFVMAAVNIPPALVSMSLSAYGEELGRLMAEYRRMVVGGVLVEDTVSGRVRLLPNGRVQAFYQLTDEDARRLVRGCAMISELLFEAGARAVYLPFEGVEPLGSADAARRLEQQQVPAEGMEVASVHVMGTAAMGADDRRHVADPYGRVYGHDGLMVADASAFPTAVGVNPMETIMMLATRNAARALERWPDV